MQPKSHRDDEILAKKLGLLFGANAVMLANLIVGAVTAWMLRDSFPREFLFGWVSATALVTACRMLLKMWFVNSAPGRQCNVCWVGRFTAGTLASGLLWGALCVGLPFWGKPHDYLLLTLVVAGMSAGALTTLMASLPAYIAYSGSFVLPLAAFSIVHPDPHIAVNGWLILLYATGIGIGARNINRAINTGVALHVDLEEASRSLENARRERDAARSEKWTTLGQLSHELRTPLNAIMGFSEAMNQEYFGPIGNVRYRDYAGHVHASGRHLMRLVDELLELSRSESGNLELKESPVEVDILIASCLDMMQAEADAAQITLNRHFARGLPLLRADKTKLRQTVLNLLSNAIKFTPAGGAVTLSAIPAPGGGIALVVEDTGIGMSQEEILVAMQPFGRVASPLNDSKPGMGLGLPMAKRLAELHGAELSIVSEPGSGTTCTIWFPAERCIGAEIAPPEGAVCASAFAA